MRRRAGRGIDSDAQLETARAAGATLGRVHAPASPGLLPTLSPKPATATALAG